MFEPSKYQKNIINSIKYDRGNLLIDAKAGSGKTSTLILISEELARQNKKSLFLAFNKKIAEELQYKLAKNGNVTVKTLNAMGYSCILSYLYKTYGKDNYTSEVLGNGTITRNLVKKYVDENLIDNIRAARFDIANDKKQFKQLYNDIVSDFIGLTNFTRYYFIDFNDDEAILNLSKVEAVKFINNLNKDNGIRPEDLVSLVRWVIQTRLDTFSNPIKESGKYKFEFDFIDQLYFPVYYGWKAPYKYYTYLDYVLCDEAQDMNVLHQRLLQQLNNGRTRYTFVGDKKQSIYGFARSRYT